MLKSKKQATDELYYIHIENLPWSACSEDVLKFFDGIAIPPSGISIYGQQALVVVMNRRDSYKALAKRGNQIHGTFIQLKSTTKLDGFRRKFLHTVRKLQFAPSVRRIRPTFLSRNSEDMFSVFNPPEIHVSDENENVLEQQPNKRKPKRIRPTLLKGPEQLQVAENEVDSADQA